jgi:NAD(P)-dependent dehydrogenase (short-subunit alcohol dehydrogenase family)
MKDEERQTVMNVEVAPSSKVSPVTRKSVLLAGASRGLGLGMAKSFAAHDWQVTATERSPSAGLRAAAAAADGRIRIERLDINDLQQVQSLRRLLANELFDVIFIVAGISGAEPARPIHEVPAQEAAHVFITNAYSPMYFAEAFFDRLKPEGTLAIMTSRIGSLTLVATDVDGTWEMYRASKAALNMLARCFYQRHGGARTLLLMHPGVVKTDMGGPDAPVDIETSVQGLYGIVVKWAGSGELVFVDYQGNILPW